MELRQLRNLINIWGGGFRDNEQVLVMTDDAELHQILSLNWDSANGMFILCVENDVEEL
jgi:hypothetical protein